MISFKLRYKFRYKIVQSLQGRSCILCFETVLGINEITLTHIFNPLEAVRDFKKAKSQTSANPEG